MAGVPNRGPVPTAADATTGNPGVDDSTALQQLYQFQHPLQNLPTDQPAKTIPDNYLERLVGLHQAHPWMPHQTAATLAAIPASDVTIAKMAAGLKTFFGNVDTAVKYVTDDPVLQKTPSLGLYLRSYLTNTLGPWPLADSDLVHLQKSLQGKGLAKGLPTNGVWTTGWNDAWTQYTDNVRLDELGGANTGSIPFGKFLSYLNDILPRQAVSAVGAWATSIPGSLVTDFHTFAGSVGGAAWDASHPRTFAQSLAHGGELTGANSQSFQSASARAENVVGAGVTPQQSFAAQSTRTQLVDTLQIVGDMLATHGLMRAGSEVAQAARETNWKGLNGAAAERGPGTIAKTVFGRKGVESGGERAPLLSPKAAASVPILRMTGPVADKIAGSEGYYYRARTLLAAPYAVPGVKVAGTAVGQLGLAGVKIRGIGAAESVVGGQQSPLDRAIQHFQAVNQFDDAVQNRLQLNAFGMHFRPSINTLAWVLHPPLGGGPGAVSRTIGKDITGLNDTIQEATGPSTGLGLSFERGINWTKHGDQRISYDELVKMAGGPTQLNQFILSKTFEHVAAHLAEQKWAKTPPMEQAYLAGQEFQDKAAVLTHWTNEYLHNAELGNVSELVRGASQMASDHYPQTQQWGGHSGFSKMIAGEIDRENLTPRAWLQKYMVPYDGNSRLMREVVIPHRMELNFDDVPGATLGMVPNDYYFRDLAVGEANRLDQNFQAAAQDLTQPGKYGEYQDARAAILAELLDKYGVDGYAMPQDDTQLMKLLHQKAEAQLPRVFPRQQATRELPTDARPQFVANQPPGPAKLDRFVSTPVFTKVKPTEAMDLIHETTNPESHQWANSRQALGTGGGTVTIEYEPADLRGELRVGNPFGQAVVDRPPGLTPQDAYDSVRSVEIRPAMLKSGSKESNAASLLQNRLEGAGFIKFDVGKGLVRWVRPDLVGGTIATSPALQDALDSMHAAGMTPVVGKALGSGFYESPLMDIGNAHLTTAKRFLESTGLSPQNVPSSDLGFTWRMNFHRLLVDAVANGQLRLFPTHTVETIIAMMRDKKAIPGTPGFASAVQQISPLGRHAYDVNLDALTEALVSKTSMTRQAAQKQVASEMSQMLENPSGLMHITKRDLKMALGQKVDRGNPAQHQMALEAERQGKDLQEMYDQHARDVIYKLIQKTNAMQPARLVGWQKAENLMSLGLSYAGKPIPGSVGRAIEYLPSRLITMRNKARFTLSPEFQLRRVVKINAKGMLDQIPPTWHPVRYLMRDGQSGFNEKMAYLDKVMPELVNPNYDEGTQALYAEDPWGIYPGTRNYAAYMADHWKQAGKTDTEVREMLIRNTTYGSKAYGEGRSALERSMNFVFFPMSFDKTLYRNVGAYLLDHTAQRIILQAGLEAYARMGPPNDNVSTWLKNHAPILNEAARLNAFAHGLGFGQFGGINAPLLNLFIPQSYSSTSQGLAVLRGMLPLVAEFQNLGKELKDTWNIGFRVTADQFQHNPALSGFKTKAAMTNAEAMQQIFFAKPVAETASASATAAYQYRRQLQALFRKEVDYNAHAHSSAKLTLSNNTSEYGEFAGHVVNATLVNDLVNLKYPTFNIADPAKFYADKAADIERFSLRMSGAGRHDVVTWITYAQKVGIDIYSNAHGMDSGMAAQYTRLYRAYAIEYAETIPGFLTFYNKNFKWQFGPLQKVR